MTLQNNPTTYRLKPGVKLLPKANLIAWVPELASSLAYLTILRQLMQILLARVIQPDLFELRRLLLVHTEGRLALNSQLTLVARHLCCGRTITCPVLDLVFVALDDLHELQLRVWQVALLQILLFFQEVVEILLLNIRVLDRDVLGHLLLGLLPLLGVALGFQLQRVVLLFHEACLSELLLLFRRKVSRGADSISLLLEVLCQW
jgi:hypothetical protein